MSATEVRRLVATQPALALLGLLQAEYGDVLFHQSGGCCDGSAPLCYMVSEFCVGERDVHLGEVGGADFYMSRDQFEYWKQTHLIIDVVPGLAGMFSLENGTGKRFMSRGRVFSNEEVSQLSRV